MAGILFTDGKMVLAGFNPHKFRITGIGGKKKQVELPYQTALRETIEEIFELNEIPPKLVEELTELLKFDSVLATKHYTTFIMNFNDLELILEKMCEYQLSSKVYDIIPTSLLGLLFLRKQVASAEFSHLTLIPCTYNLEFDNSLLVDIYSFKNCERSML